VKIQLYSSIYGDKNHIYTLFASSS